MFDQQCALGTNLCLEEAIWLWIYLPNFKSNQNWNRNHTETFSGKKESQRIASYNLTETTLMFLWFLRWQKTSAPPLQLPCISKTENRDIQKLTLHHSYLSKWQNSIKFWVPEYFLYHCTLLIKIQLMGSTIIFTSKFFFTA